MSETYGSENMAKPEIRNEEKSIYDMLSGLTFRKQNGEFDIA